MSTVPQESPLPCECPLCGGEAVEFHDQDDVHNEWASYECQLVLLVDCNGRIEWDEQCAKVLPRWVASANKAMLSKSATKVG